VTHFTGDRRKCLEGEGSKQISPGCSTKELTGNGTWARTGRCVFKARISHTQCQKTDNRIERTRRGENKSFPYRWVHLWEVKLKKLQ
jgi:hypothetical protein